MKSKIKHIGIFTSDGDAPGMNTALFAAAKTAALNGIKISGIRKGFEGLIDNDLVPLDSHQLQKAMHMGGTILKTARSDRFMTPEGRDKALETIERNQIDTLIAIGGNGTFRGMLSLSGLANIACIGIPGSHCDMVELVHTISQRIAKYLEKVGLVQRDMENSYLNLPVDDEVSLLQLQGASVSYRITMGPQQSQKVFTLQTLPTNTEGEYGQLANMSGFSLHAGTFV